MLLSLKLTEVNIEFKKRLTLYYEKNKLKILATPNIEDFQDFERQAILVHKTAEMLIEYTKYERESVEELFWEILDDKTLTIFKDDIRGYDVVNYDKYHIPILIVDNKIDNKVKCYKYPTNYLAGNPTDFFEMIAQDSHENLKANNEWRQKSGEGIVLENEEIQGITNGVRKELESGKMGWKEYFYSKEEGKGFVLDAWR